MCSWATKAGFSLLCQWIRSRRCIFFCVCVCVFWLLDKFPWSFFLVLAHVPFLLQKMCIFFSFLHATNVAMHVNFIYSVVISHSLMKVLICTLQVYKSKKQVMSEIILKSKFYKVVSLPCFNLRFPFST